MRAVCRVLSLTIAAFALVMLTGCPPTQPAGETSPKPGETPKTDPGNKPTAGGAGTKTSWGEDGGVVIGSYMSLTGGTATFGQSSNMAMGMAVEQANAKGGVLGKKIKLVVEDAASKAEDAANAAQRLLDVHKVCLGIGEVASSLSLAAAPSFQKAGIPMLTPASTNPEVTKKGDCIFRSCFTDDQQGAYVASFAIKKGLKKGVILKDITSDYSKGLTEVIGKVFPGSGRTIDRVEAYKQGDRDFAAILTKIKELKPDVIFIPGYYEEVGLIIKQAREQGITATLLGADGWDSPKLAEIAGASLDDKCFFVNHYAQSDPRPVVQAFVTEFRKRYNEDPDALAACAYDAMNIALRAIERAQGTDKDALKKALAATKDYDGVTGTITLDADRNASKSCVVLGFEGGKQKAAGTITPADLKAK
ncbi:MAG: ABC transporter substrate-binding protein [Armatimonadetes bacterium]|nr:ABC transporter substrate-binding protein [Armatimonadota bacterium]